MITDHEVSTLNPKPNTLCPSSFDSSGAGMEKKNKSLFAEPEMVVSMYTQRVHVGIWYVLRAQRGSHIPTLRPKYIPYSYMDPLGQEYPDLSLAFRVDIPSPES